MSARIHVRRDLRYPCALFIVLHPLRRTLDDYLVRIFNYGLTRDFRARYVDSRIVARAHASRFWRSLLLSQPQQSRF